MVAPSAVVRRRPSLTVMLLTAVVLVGDAGLVWTAWRWGGEQELYKRELTFRGLGSVMLLGLSFLPCVRRWHPAGFRLAEGAFVADPKHRVLLAEVGSTLTAGCYSLVGDSWVDLVLAVVSVLAGLGAAGYWLRGGGRIELRPEGIRVGRLFGRRDIPWDSIAAAPEREPEPRRLSWLTLRLTGGREADLPAPMSDVDRAVLIDAIAFFVTNPAARGWIGTHGGYTKLAGQGELRVG